MKLSEHLEPVPVSVRALREAIAAFAQRPYDETTAGTPLFEGAICDIPLSHREVQTASAKETPIYRRNLVLDVYVQLDREGVSPNPILSSLCWLPTMYPRQRSLPGISQTDWETLTDTLEIVLSGINLDLYDTELGKCLDLWPMLAPIFLAYWSENCAQFLHLLAEYTALKHDDQRLTFFQNVWTICLRERGGAKTGRLKFPMLPKHPSRVTNDS